ncbi:P-loop containing nucleoside triphosphate hydrolase protein [Xylariaceae sp. FL0804]|nr:P-loop containing nucleoside triphosphate hydrolase protein [Xylariaceae sp. FL0804]
MGGVASIPTDPSRQVQVISAGYSRTGTVSMSLALARLLDGPVNHGGTQILIRDDDYCRTWIKAYEAREAGNRAETLKLVRKATAGFVATADMPAMDFMPEMMELYPDAKVVLVRRDPVRWWKSMESVVSRTVPWWLGPVMAPIPGWRYIPSFAAHYSRSTLALAGVADEKAGPADLLVRGGPHILEAHHARVRSLVPPGQLLEFELADGWGPLCRFLGVPAPPEEEPFPRANDAEAADRYATGILLKVFGLWLGALALACWLVYVGFRVVTHEGEGRA